MQEEVTAAATVLARIIGQLKDLKENKIKDLSKALEKVMMDTFNDHWYKEKPLRGQGFRCIRVNGTTPIHPILLKAAETADLSPSELKLPSEVSIWVDPNFVTCRFGEDVGTERRILWQKDSGEIENRADSLDLSDVLKSSRLPFYSTKQTPASHYDEDAELEAPAVSGLPLPGISHYQNSMFSAPRPSNSGSPNIHLGPHGNGSSPGMHHGNSSANHGSPSGRFPRGGANHRPPRNTASNGGPGPDRFNGWQPGSGKQGKFSGIPPHGKIYANGQRHPPPQHPPWSRGGGEMAKA